MSLLYIFEALRTPVLDLIGTGVTFFGSEIFLLVVLGIVYWSVDKELGYRLAFAYTVSGTINNIMKICFRIPRPWVKDSEFTTTEGAKDGATGYSFPSGHSNNIGVIGTTFIMNTHSVFIKIIAVLLMALVPVSRMYLGVHTPADVAAGLILAVVTTVIVNKIMSSTTVDAGGLSSVMFAMMLFPLALLIVALSLYYNGIIEFENMSDSIKSSGAFFGFIIGWYIEKTKINFNTRCSNFLKQILKLLLGFAGVFIIRFGLKFLFALIDETFWPGDFIRYFAMTFFAMGIYPWFIKRLFSSKVPYNRR